MGTTYYSPGKLLLTGEYVVLDGAMALAIPTKYGQSLVVSNSESTGIHWKSYNEEGGIWFEDFFSYNDLISEERSMTASNSIREKLLIILREAWRLNPTFLNKTDGWQVATRLNFSREWGLGTSSTLINNIAQWAEVNAFKLLKNSFGGSGYDIAVAQSASPILYKIQDGLPFIEPVKIHWDFTDQLYFIHLNRKQDSKEGISRYRNVSTTIIELSAISAISHSILACETLSTFEKLVEKHEAKISKIIQKPTIKAEFFSDYPKAIKSLGAWGGDFILVTAEEEDLDYFRNKGYQTIIPFAEMML